MLSKDGNQSRFIQQRRLPGANSNSSSVFRGWTLLMLLTQQSTCACAPDSNRTRHTGTQIVEMYDDELLKHILGYPAAACSSLNTEYNSFRQVLAVTVTYNIHSSNATQLKAAQLLMHGIRGRECLVHTQGHALQWKSGPGNCRLISTTLSYSIPMHRARTIFPSRHRSSAQDSRQHPGPTVPHARMYVRMCAQITSNPSVQQLQMMRHLIIKYHVSCTQVCSVHLPV
jgi:hypothetical protein